MKQLILLLVFLLTTNLFSQVPKYVPKNGLLGWWGFNGNAYDESGNGNNGNLFGANFTSDRYEVSQQACILNGLNDYVMIDFSPASRSDLNSNNQLTISLWMQLPQQFNQSTLYLVGNKSYSHYGSDGFFVFIDQNDGAYGKNNYLICFGVGSASATYITNQNEVSNWTNIIGTYQNGIISLYINGELKRSNDVFGSPKSTSTKLVFADWDNPTPPKDKVRKIDDIGLWNRALLQTEINELIKTKATGIQEDKFYSFLIYPNPTNSYVTIDCGDQAEVSTYSFVITNSLGQEKVTSKFTSRYQQIDISGIGGAGLYIISIRDGNNTVIETRKLLIQ